MNTSEPQPPFRALCVDDHKDSANSFAMFLRALGFEPRACYDGPSALLLNEQFRPGVCFLDLTMPGMDGDELARLLRSGSGWRPLLLVAVTAMSDEASRDRVAAAGIDLHLIKPVGPKAMVEVVDRLFLAAGKAVPLALAADGPR